jgi:hypothetical protein
LLSCSLLYGRASPYLSLPPRESDQRSAPVLEDERILVPAALSVRDYEPARTAGRELDLATAARLMDASYAPQRQFLVDGKNMLVPAFHNVRDRPGVTRTSATAISSTAVSR